MPKDAIKKRIGGEFSTALQITNKKHSDGYFSSMRIVPKKKCDLQSNPIPSYIQVSGREIYVNIALKKAVLAISFS